MTFRNGMGIRSLLVGACGLFAAFSGAVNAQEGDFPHPELEWRTIDSPHFYVHYHEGAERTARVVSRIAEEIFEPVTALYDHRPSEKVSLIIRDVDDISNGAAYFYENRIELFAPSMDFELRGTHNWLRNVVTHEFTHIVQIQTAMKFGRTVPAIYLQWLNYESERRPDVLYGYPNVIASYPVSGFVVPAWFAEGAAQYNREELRYDFWDTHRDMILRSYALDGSMLTWEQMGVFGKTSLGNESSYNAGFAFVAYLAHRYGEESVVGISRALGTLTEVTIDGAIRRVLGKDGRTVYDEWRQEITAEYAERTAPVREMLRQGTPLSFGADSSVVDPEQIATDGTMLHPRGGLPLHRQMLPCCAARAAVGFANLYPAYSPDGTRLAYTSAKQGDYFGLSALYIYDFRSGKEELIARGVRTAVAWAPDGHSIVYAKNTRENPHWSLQFDLYEYDFASRDERRLTRGRRASQPAISPDGKRIAFVVNGDGTSNLAAVNVDGTEFRTVTAFATGEQVYSPQWSPSGEGILFDFSIRDGRDLAMIRPDGTELHFLEQGPEDTRSAVFSRDGSTIVYSSDRSGIFNLYRRNLATGVVEQMTNVTGGAFLPTLDSAGRIIYAGYTSRGYKLFLYDSLQALPAGAHAYAATTPQRPPATGGPSLAPVRQASGSSFDWAALRGYDDSRFSDTTSRSYRPVFTSLTVVPFIRVDNYNSRSRGIDLVKPGLYLFSSDVLDKTGFLASGSLNLRGERDLYLEFDYRGKIPGLYHIGLEPTASVELFNVTRKTGSVLSLPASQTPVDVTYDLLEFDFALRQRALTQFSDIEFRYAHSRYASLIGSFVLNEGNSPVLSQGSRELYLIANTFTLSLNTDAIVPSRTSEINPVGRKILLRLSRELNKFNGDNEYEVSSSVGLRPLYKSVNFTRGEARWSEHLTMPFSGHTLSATLHGGTIFGPPVDEFFDFYAGGLLGMRGYPFYALGGNRMARLGLEYRFPLVHNIDFRFLQLYFDKLYLSFFGDIGNAWSAPQRPRFAEFKRDIGAELRLESFSFYSYPTRFFLSAAYGLDRFDREVPQFEKDGPTQVTYGKEWRFYLGVLFNFDLD